jgi:hypothetical protein
MGNTGVALARDGSAPFINPATIVNIEDQRLAFSVNFFTYSVRHFSEWNQPGPVDNSKFGDVALGATGNSSTRFQALPSTLCLFFTLASFTPFGDDPEAKPAARKGGQKLAFCLGSLESDNVSLTALSFNGATAAGKTSQIESISSSWNRLYIGPTYGVQLTDKLALGASLHTVITADSFVVDATNITALTGGTSGQSALGTSGYGYSVDVLANLGATYRIGKLTLGIDAQLPSLHGFGHFQATAHDDYTAPTATADVANATGTFSAPTPVRIAGGIGYQWPRLTVEADGSVEFPWANALSSSLNVTTTHLAGTTQTQADTTQSYTVATRPVFNSGIGAEYFVSRGFSLIGGASTNLTALKPLAPTTSVGNFVQERTNHVSLAFGIGSYGGSNDILIGTQLDFGWGDAITVNPYQLPNTWAVVGTQTYGVLLVLSGTTSLRAIGRAVEKVENAVEGKPENAKPTFTIPGSK